MDNAPKVEGSTCGTSALSAGLGVANCKHCGSKDYTIQLLHVGFRQRILVVECRECRYDLIPVVLDYFMPEAECYTKCREAWNAANETTNAALTGGEAVRVEGTVRGENPGKD